MTGTDLIRLRRVIRKISEKAYATGRIRKSLPIVAERKARIESAVALAKTYHSRWKRLRKIGDNQELVRDLGNDSEET